MKMMKVAALVLDFNLYPRPQVDGHHVTAMCEADKAGVDFPPVLIDKKSKRVTDGFHRVHKARRLKQDEIGVVEKSYRNEGEMLLDAMRYNASHGRNLSSYDRAHAIILAGNLGLDDAAVADALSITTERVQDLRVDRSAKAGKLSVPIKRTIGHMAGRKLTRPQVEANVKLGGMNQLFYVNQLLILLESDLLDKENEDLIEGLRKLHGLLDGVLAVA